MLGTFKPNDLLTLEMHPDRVQAGDVIVFQVADLRGERHLIVHRVLKVTPQGLITRGDNQTYRDPFVVPYTSLKGVVTTYDRDGQIYPVQNGMPGLLRARVLHVRALLWLLILLSGHRFYRALRESKLMRRVVHPHITLIRLHSPDTQTYYYKYVWRKRTVARWYPDRHVFLVDKPFDLFIDPPNS